MTQAIYDAHMLTTQRKQFLLTRLQAQGQIVAKAMSQELGISEDTIRRDLRELAQEGKLQRVHGGALPSSEALGNVPQRRQVATEEKIALARAGAAMVKAGQIVLLDGGTTAVQLARALPQGLTITVVTHSPEVAVELGAHPAIDVVMLGGKLFRHSMVNMGASTLVEARHIQADIYFMGVAGVHAELGLTTGDFEEASIKRALHKQAAETVVLASSEKLGAVSPYFVAHLQDISTLILSPVASQAAGDALQRAGLSIVYC